MIRREKDYFISRMFCRLLVPSLFSSVGFALADMMDSIVLGQRMGEVGLAATNLCLPLFMLINSYTTGLQPMVLNNILTLSLKGYSGKIDAYEVGIATEEGIPLPCGAGGMFIHE